MIYFDNAATSFPKPKRVYDRMNQFLREEAANPGRSGHRLSVAAEGQIAQARSLLAKFFNVKGANRIIFTLNGTDSLNIAIKGALRDGDHAVTTVLEHNSVLRPLHALETAKKITLTKVKPDSNGVVDPHQIKKMILPFLTGDTNSAISPFPPPILTSGGFLLIGLSGKTLIHTLPPLWV